MWIAVDQIEYTQTEMLDDTSVVCSLDMLTAIPILARNVEPEASGSPYWSSIIFVLIKLDGLASVAELSHGLSVIDFFVSGEKFSLLVVCITAFQSLDAVRESLTSLTRRYHVTVTL